MDVKLIVVALGLIFLIENASACRRNSQCSSGWCEGGGVWKSGHCKAKRHDGQQCSNGDGNSCHSKQCTCGLCGRKQNTGAVCATNDNCHSNWCEKRPLSFGCSGRCAVRGRPIDQAFKFIRVDRTRNPRRLTVTMRGRPTASGIINEAGLVQTGYVNFPDDRRYNFWYYPKEATIYWDNVKGRTSNIWRGGSGKDETVEVEDVPMKLNDEETITIGKKEMEDEKMENENIQDDDITPDMAPEPASKIRGDAAEPAMKALDEAAEPAMEVLDEAAEPASKVQDEAAKETLNEATEPEIAIASDIVLVPV